MKALSLTQPWATLIILGIKKWETRSWYPPARMRGQRIVVHASKGWRTDDRLFADRLRRDGILPMDADLPRGAALGTVRLDGLIRTDPALVVRHIDARERLLGDYNFGRFAWELGDPRPFDEPIPARGALGLWEWSSGGTLGNLTSTDKGDD